MTQRYRLVLLLFLLSYSLPNGFGQTPADKPISGDFTNLRFAQFVQEIEAKTPYRFFYNPTDVDSLIVDLHVENKPLRAVLQQLFRESKYAFAIDNQQRVYITVNRLIRTELPIGFFTRGASDSDADSTAAAYLTETRKKRPEPEAKLYEIGKRTTPIRPGRSTIAGHVRNRPERLRPANQSSFGNNRAGIRS